LEPIAYSIKWKQVGAGIRGVENQPDTVTVYGIGPIVTAARALAKMEESDGEGVA